MPVSQIVFLILGIGVLVVAVIVFSFFSVWLRASLAGAPVGMLNLLAMKLRQVPFSLIVDARVTARKAGIVIPTDDIEAHFLAGGNVVPTVQALIAAQKANLSLDWRQACSIDLATKGSGKSVSRPSAPPSTPRSSTAPTPPAAAPPSTASPRTASR